MSQNIKGGHMVTTKKGLKGRTYHSKGWVNDKLPVYLENEDGSFKKVAMLCDPKTVTRIGFID